STMTNFVSWVAHQERFLFNNIAFNLLQVIASYLVIIGLVAVFKKMDSYRLGFVLTTILLFQSVLIYNKYQIETNEFIIFHKSRHSMIAHKTGTELSIANNFDSLT